VIDEKIATHQWLEISELAPTACIFVDVFPRETGKINSDQANRSV